MREFWFDVDPREDLFDRMERWDKQIHELQAAGLTIRGTGPDGDDPIRIEAAPAPINPNGLYDEVYEVVSL